MTEPTEPHATDAPAAHGDRPRGDANADIKGPRAFDARVIAKYVVSEHEIGFAMLLPKDVDRDVVTIDWSGMFLSDGKPIANTEFKLTNVSGSGVRAVIKAAQLPSERVRLYEPGKSR